MDVLSNVLRAVRLTGAVFFDVEASAPWVATTPKGAAIAGHVMPEAEHVITFHAVTAGGYWAELEDGSAPAFRVDAGDIVMAPMADPHVLCSAPGMRAPPSMGMYYRPTDRQLPFIVDQLRGGGERTRFVCGYLGCDIRLFNPVLRALPRIVHARGADGAAHLAQLMRMAIDESATRRAGGETVLSKVAELMFVEVVRRHIASLPQDAGGGCPACATRTSAGRLPSCTVAPPRGGQWSAWRSRWGCHAPCSPIASRISCRIPPCTT